MNFNWFSWFSTTRGHSCGIWLCAPTCYSRGNEAKGQAGRVWHTKRRASVYPFDKPKL